MATQEERRNTTRQAIVDAAFSAYSSEGSPDVSLESIAAAAGVTKGTIHYHFRNRAGLMRAVALAVFLDIEDKVLSTPRQSDLDEAINYISALLKEQATPAGRVLFTIGDELARTGDLKEIDPYLYLRNKLTDWGIVEHSGLLAAAVTQYGRQLAYGLTPASEIAAMIASIDSFNPPGRRN